MEEKMPIEEKMPMQEKMPMENRKAKRTLNVIGAGRVGCLIGLLCRWHGVAQVQDVLGRDRSRTQAAVTQIGSGIAVTDITSMRPARLWLVTTPDAQIAPLAAQLAKAALVRAGDVVIHCSGALGSAVLAPLQAQGALIASVHPLKSVADALTAADTFAGTFCALEGDAAALAVVQPLFISLGARCAILSAEQKLRYHTASVLVCNGLTALIEAGLRTYQLAGIKRNAGMALLTPLMQETLSHANRLGAARALTGPVARGDAGVVAQQLTLLRPLDPAVAAIYQALSVVALDLAKVQGVASVADLAAVGEVLAQAADAECAPPCILKKSL